MRYLSLAEVAELHRLLIEAFGGSHGIRDLGGSSPRWRNLG